MKKNVAGQKIGAQMVSATDGSNFTGSVTVYVTLDAGTQAIGTVGSGVCTHEGNGYHTYAPSQAETNGDLVAFTFIGTGAISSTVQIYTGFPQSVDNATDITTILADTNDIQSRLPAALVSGRMDSSVGAMATDTITSTALAASAVTEIQSGLSTLDAAGIRSAVGLASANLDTQLTAIDDYLDTEVAAIKAKTDQLTFTTANQVDATAITVSDKTGYRLSSTGVDDVLDEVVEGSTTLRQSIRLSNSANAGKTSGMETTSGTIRDIGDTKNRITATLDGNGNRTAVTVDVT